MSAATSAEILHVAAAFFSEALAQPDLRRRIFSAFRSAVVPSHDQFSVKSLTLAAGTLENAISTANPSIRTSSLRLAEKLLLTWPSNAFSSLLLSLIYYLCNRPTDACLSLLDVFRADPSLARSEVAPQVFEELFLRHFVPVLQWYNEQRSKILSSVSLNSGYYNDDWSVVDDPGAVSWSKMSGDQALELKELERDYEGVLDENCRIFAEFFKALLGNKDGNGFIDPPLVVLEAAVNGRDRFACQEEEKTNVEDSELENGRYNPIWADGEKSVELQRSKSKRLSKFPSFFPERVSPRILTNRNDFDSEVDGGNSGSSPPSPSSPSSSSDSDAEQEVKDESRELFACLQHQSQKQQEPISEGSSHCIDPFMEETDNPPGGGKQTPPKDFVCPITTHTFDDPVTLETGQTYERRAIQEWLDRGNSTCPITRQRLHSTRLPRTNYVLKRLIASWKELNADLDPTLTETPHFQESEPVFGPDLQLTSPNSVISQATIDGTVNELRAVITKLCTSEVLRESEMAVQRIERFWRDANAEVEIQIMLSRPPVVNGFVEILFNSVDTRVLKSTIFLLSELGSRDYGVIQTLTRVDSDVECVVALFKKGLFEAVVLIYLLRPSINSLIESDLVSALLDVVIKKDDELLRMCITPKAAAVILIGRILRAGGEETISKVVRAVVSGKAIESIVSSLQSEFAEERSEAVRLLWKCMKVEGKCRNVVADKAELAPVLESLFTTSEGERFEIIQFLSELVKLKRRTFNEQVLHIIKDEGTFSTMHALLVYLQTAPQDQCPVIAGLLLQLDLLAEPRKMSIYREEAIDSLISCLRNSEFPAAQIAAAETILSLQGRFSSSGKPLARAFLLKRAGFDRYFRSAMSQQQPSSMSGEIQDATDEEKAAEEWERKMAYVLVSHEFGLLFEALAEGLKSRYAELCSSCFVSATWLVHMLTYLPNTGIQGAAQVCLLNPFVSIFKSAKDNEDKALAMLALSSFFRDPEGLRNITVHMKEILKGLKEFKKSSAVATEILKVLLEGNESSADLWNHKVIAQEDCSTSGEVLSIVCIEDKIFSGHSDGRIKVWKGKGRPLHLIQETREHTKAVTSLTVQRSGNMLYSGSLDRSVRAWSLNKEGIHCEEVYDMNDQVSNLLVANSICCFIPQGAGIKVQSWTGASKLLNQNKYVKCLDLVLGKLYCGCQDHSIQEIDLATGTLSSIQSGTRKLLGKANPVHAVQVREGLIYSACSSMEGTTLKIWSASNYSPVGSVSTTQDARVMAISSELIYLGCKGGAVEVWCRKKLTRNETLQTGSNGRVTCMALDSDEDALVVGTSNGKIQAWEVS